MKSSLEKFLAKRVFFIFVVLTIISVVFIGQRWVFISGLAVGASLSILKISSYLWIFSKMIPQDNKKRPIIYDVGRSLLNFAVNQLLVLVLLYISLKINQWLFYGFVSGIVSVPAVIMFNSITEVTKITHNNFE